MFFCLDAKEPKNQGCGCFATRSLHFAVRIANSRFALKQRSNSDAFGRSVPVVRLTLTSRGRSCFSSPSASGSFSSLVVMLTRPLSLDWILHRFFSCLFPYLSLLKIHWAYIPEYLNFDNLFYCGLRYNLHL